MFEQYVDLFVWSYCIVGTVMTYKGNFWVTSVKHITFRVDIIF